MRKYNSSILASDARYSGSWTTGGEARGLGATLESYWGRHGVRLSLLLWTPKIQAHSIFPLCCFQKKPHKIIHGPPALPEKSLSIFFLDKSLSRLTSSLVSSSRAFPNPLWHLSQFSGRLLCGSTAYVCPQGSGWPLCTFLQLSIVHICSPCAMEPGKVHSVKSILMHVWIN